MDLDSLITFVTGIFNSIIFWDRGDFLEQNECNMRRQHFLVLLSFIEKLSGQLTAKSDL